ncbi:MAG: hypothetical protein WBX25_19950 [Rhodomicrobium sp.]
MCKKLITSTAEACAHAIVQAYAYNIKAVVDFGVKLVGLISNADWG